MVETLPATEQTALDQIRLDRNWSIDELASDIEARLAVRLSPQTLSRVLRTKRPRVLDTTAHQIRRYLAAVRTAAAPVPSGAAVHEASR